MKRGPVGEENRDATFVDVTRLAFAPREMGCHKRILKRDQSGLIYILQGYSVCGFENTVKKLRVKVGRLFGRTS